MPQAPISKPHDGANFSIVPGAYALPLIMTCEHASNALPPEYGQLGLPQDTLDSHFGWDIGAWATLLRIASTINCSVIGSLYSRLLVDLNRRTDESSLIPRQLGGQIIPGNWPLPSEEAWGRIERFYDPYHDAIKRSLDTYRQRHGQNILLIAFHSFTPSWPGQKRDFDIGVLFDEHQAPSLLMATKLEEQGLRVELNKPYSGRRGEIFSAWHHGMARGIIYFEIEVNQGCLVDQAGRKRIADSFSATLPDLTSALLSKVDGGA